MPFDLTLNLSPNHGARRKGVLPTMIILHYTAMPSLTESLTRLCDPRAQVSAHYVVGQDGQIVSLVPEERRAWHAGASYWRGVRDVNSASIGIEMQNLGAQPYPPEQITAVCALCKDIMARYKIQWVLAHSDVAPARKRDPGVLFPWITLAKEGVGVWPPALFALPILDEQQVHSALLALGYDPECDTPTLIRAFQRHWAPPVTGKPCLRTRTALSALVSGV